VTKTSLTPDQRAASVEAMQSQTFDVLVIGGGVTGAGIALDAASRGLSTAVVDYQDWAAGTSSRSSRLVHGGLRYLYNLDFKLVAEALKERGRLLTTIAPHLVEAQPFLWPLKTPVVERAYSAVGVGMYDALAVIGAGGRKTVPTQKHLSKKAAIRHFPEVKADALCGAIEFYDARVDDARLVITLIRTALKYGAEAASRIKVTGIVKDEKGAAAGAEVTDLETGASFTIRAKKIINATGVWTEETQDMAGGTGGLKVLASKGIHIVIPRERLKAKAGMFLRTEKSVLFIIPWQHYWVIGTTDTAWHEQLENPVPTSADIDYVLAHANEVLDKPLTRDDIIGTYAGLRPLLQPKVLDESKSTKVSREHTVSEVIPGMVAIAGGKLTTYRVMAEDAVDFAARETLQRLGAGAGRGGERAPHHPPPPPREAVRVRRRSNEAPAVALRIGDRRPAGQHRRGPDPRAAAAARAAVHPRRGLPCMHRRGGAAPGGHLRLPRPAQLRVPRPRRRVRRRGGRDRGEGPGLGRGEDRGGEDQLPRPDRRRARGRGADDRCRGFRRA